MRATAKVTGGDLPGLTERIRNLQQLARCQIETGVLGNEIDPGPSDGPTLVQIAGTLEFGDPRKRIPARPWLRESVDRYAQKWSKQFGKTVRLINMGRPEAVDRSLRITALEMVGDVTQTLYDGPWAENSERTVREQWESRGSPGTLDAYRASKKPLIDTGQLVQSHRSQLLEYGGSTSYHRPPEREVVG